jgi:predicted Zn-dependent protease
MKIYHNLLLNVILISILTVLVSLPHLLLSSSSYFFNQYATAAAHSSLRVQKATEENVIQICCSWSNQIADGILTYRIVDDGNSKVVKAVHQAIDEWNSKLANIQLQEITDSNTPADIDINTNSKAPRVAHSTIRTNDGHTISDRKNIKLVQPGEASISFDASGLITHVDMTISTKALGNSISSSKLESIAKHEIGHAYGIGHTYFIDDLMSPILTGSSNEISQCDINAIEEANQWKLKQDSNSPHAPPLQFLRC